MFLYGFAYAPQSPGDLLRYRAIQGQHDLPKWYAEIVDNGATHVYVSRKDEAFDLILAHPEKFRLLMRRLDSHYDILNSGLIVPAWPEDALFEVTSGMSNE